MKQNKFQSIINRSNKIYDAAAQKFGISSGAVFWNVQQSQYFRFSELVKNLNLQDGKISILDIGCGNGELYKFLNFLGFRGKYTGYDINEGLLKQARKRFPGLNVTKKDIRTDTIKTKFDYVLCSGLFNSDVGQSLEYIQQMIKKMFTLCDKALMFNMVSTHVNFREQKMFYADPAVIFNFCVKNLSKRVTLAHHNLPYNFTTCVFKGPDWKSIK